MGGEMQRVDEVLSVTDPDARLRAVVELAQAMAAAQSPLAAVQAAAGRAREALGAAMAAVSVWDRESGRLRVLVNHGDLAPGEEPLPEDESYPVADFPEIVSFLDAQRRLPRAWVQTVEDDVAEAPEGTPAQSVTFCRERAAGLRRRGRSCCLVAPIVLHGRAWGELYLARTEDSPVFTAGDTDFATLVAAQISAGLAQTERLEDLRRLAFTDPLTGLANRRAVDGRLDAALEAHRRDGTVVSMVVCDVNGLKRINDVHGHEVGDRLLERFAGLLSLCGARLPGSMAARLGGDEFCLLAEGQDADEVVRVAEDLCVQALELGEHEGVACGVASTGDPIGPVATSDRLFRLADAAQYRAKAARAAEPVVAGRGRSPDAVVQLADSAESEAHSGGRGGRGVRRGDRRRFRGAMHSADAGRLLTAVLSSLDAGHTAEGRPVRVAHPADTTGRLVAVAETTSRMLDAVAWWVSYVPPGSRLMRTVRYSVRRRTRGPTTAGAQAQRALNEAPDAVFDLASYPLSERAVRGDSFVLRTGSPGNEPTEEAMLVVGGYSGMVAAGGSNPAGGWLIEIFADESTLPLAGLGPVLRALVAVAVSGPASPPD